MDKTLSVIIVSWNVREKLRQNLRTLAGELASLQKEGWYLEVFVVDNNSEDGSAEMVAREFPDVHLVENQANFGFAKANNQVLRHIESPYALLLNPDMQVKPGALAAMLGWMEANPQAAVAGCRLIDDKGHNIPHVRAFPGLWDQALIILKVPHFFPGVLRRYIISDFDYSKSSRVPSVRGGFFFLALKRIADLPFFLDRTLPELDERYFLWFEEVDYCRQIERAGGQVWYTEAATCLDHVGASFQQLPRGQAQKYFQDSMLSYFRKWHSARAAFLLSLLWPVGRTLASWSVAMGWRQSARRT